MLYISYTVLVLPSGVSVTQDGKLYACGEATSGRLGLGISNGNVPIPKQITSLSQYVIKKVRSLKKTY